MPGKFPTTGRLFGTVWGKGDKFRFWDCLGIVEQFSSCDWSRTDHLLEFFLSWHFSQFGADVPIRRTLVENL